MPISRCSTPAGVCGCTVRPSDSAKRRVMTHTDMVAPLRSPPPPLPPPLPPPPRPPPPPLSPPSSPPPRHSGRNLAAAHHGRVRRCLARVRGGSGGCDSDGGGGVGVGGRWRRVEPPAAAAAWARACSTRSGAPPSPHACALARRRGIVTRDRRCRRLTAQIQRPSPAVCLQYVRERCHCRGTHDAACARAAE